MFANRKRTLMVGLLAAGLAGVGSSWAQMGPRSHGPEGQGPMLGFGKLHKELNLNAQQEELWKKAQAAQRDAFRSMRAKSEETRSKLRAEIDKPGADLKQFAQLRDQLGSQMHAQIEAVRTQVRASWVAVYDALDTQQKEQVRVAIRDGMDRGGRMGRHHRGGPHGEALGERSGSEHEHG